MPRTKQRNRAPDPRNNHHKTGLGPSAVGTRPRQGPKSALTIHREAMVATGLYKSKSPKPRIGRDNGKAHSTKVWQDKFIRVLRASHSITKAVAAANITRGYAYQCKAADPSFRERWINAWEAGIDELEAEAHRRAMEGSDLLLIFMLKGNRGKKYRDRVSLENPDGTPASFTLNIARAKDPDGDQVGLSAPEDIYDVPPEDVQELQGE